MNVVAECQELPMEKCKADCGWTHIHSSSSSTQVKGYTNNFNLCIKCLWETPFFFCEGGSSALLWACCGKQKGVEKKRGFCVLTLCFTRIVELKEREKAVRIGLDKEWDKAIVNFFKKMNCDWGGVDFGGYFCQRHRSQNERSFYDDCARSNNNWHHFW